MASRDPLILREMVRRGLQGIRPGLERISRVCAELDSPQRRLGRTVLVAGTNGKGSTCAFLEAISRAAGLRTALFTSPHLADICERVRLDGSDIPPEQFDAATARVLEAEVRSGVLLTGFELVTAAGFLAMADFGPAVTVLEVGMGGRLDATNISAPEVTVISPVGLDHGRYLGTTVAAVMGEKAGILRRGVACFVGRQDGEGWSALTERAAAVEAPLLALGRDFHGAGSAEAWSGRFAAGEIGPVRLALPGSYQVENAATAAAVALHLLGDGILAGGALRRGLEEARWPGRFDLRTVEGTELLLDGAHNPHAMEAFIRAFRERWDHRPAVLFALKEDKDADAMCALLADLADSLVITVPGGVAGVPPEELARRFPHHRVQVEPDPARALDLLVRGKGNNVGVCCGSFYLVGTLLQLLARREERKS